MNPEDTTPTTESFPKTAEQFAARNAARRARSIARDLHDLAAQFERTAAQFEADKPRTQPYAALAGEITQRLYNDLAAMGFGMLIQEAAQADIARAKGE